MWAGCTAPPLARREGLPPPSLGIGGGAAGSMAGGGADPLSKGGEGGLHTMGVSCRLGQFYLAMHAELQNIQDSIIIFLTNKGDNGFSSLCMYKYMSRKFIYRQYTYS